MPIMSKYGTWIGIMVLIMFDCSMFVSTELAFTPPFDTDEFDNSLNTLDGRYGLWWTLDSDTQKLTIAVAADTEGWVGFGLNDYPGMPGADIVMLRNDGEGLILLDMHADEYAAPSPDQSDDITEVDSGRVDGVSYFIYERNFMNCDKNNDKQIVSENVVMHALFAFGGTDELKHHGYENRESMQFTFSAKDVDAELPSDVEELVIESSTGLNVPSASGSYGCSYHILPSDKKYHLVKYKVLRGTADSNDVLHHVNLNVCENPVDGLVDGEVVNCDVVMGSCSETLLSAGYSEEGTVLPGNVGIPIGKDSSTYVVISRHYYNPQSLSHVVDTGTSYKIWYTPTLRENEIGVLQLGTVQIKIPALENNYDITSLCHSDCLSDIPEEGLTITEVNYHMHDSGIAAYTQVIRDGKEIAELARIDPFDPSHPGVTTHYKLLAGDKLITHCIYNNKLNRELQFGDTLGDEMCVGTVTYYPRIDGFAGCVSFPWGFPDEEVPPECDPCFETYCNTCREKSIEEICEICNCDYCVSIGQESAPSECDPCFEDFCTECREENPNVCDECYDCAKKCDFSLPRAVCGDNQIVFSDEDEYLAQFSGFTPYSSDECADENEGEVEYCNIPIDYVVAGDSSNSYLFQKLVQKNPSCGNQMPLSGSVSEEEIAIIRTWIDEGAKAEDFGDTLSILKNKGSGHVGSSSGGLNLDGSSEEVHGRLVGKPSGCTEEVICESDNDSNSGDSTDSNLDGNNSNNTDIDEDEDGGIDSISAIVLVNTLIFVLLAVQ
eukprot:TRINITY_DN6247_c0_g1_i1.p1 TRINITY_DN6247_c0_g1~~TRINITY_DN6247_c0_g1_i1.p1  ORF type:complete len:777 (-),score=197.49 TRINITY_DN6247_c0_g1_i1:23-2353(-)